MTFWADKLDRAEAAAWQDHCRALLNADPTVGVRRRGSARWYRTPG
ncbi:MAG: hypothetical protein IPN53_21080 [Comamonadaceae bacterium]|nr:hypothetical protein [Comamonadaceae bacterium]